MKALLHRTVGGSHVLDKTFMPASAIHAEWRCYSLHLETLTNLVRGDFLPVNLTSATVSLPTLVYLAVSFSPS